MQEPWIDTTTPIGEAMYHITIAWAQLEKRQLTERVKAGMDRARAEGKPLGRQPLTLPVTEHPGVAQSAQLSRAATSTGPRRPRSARPQGGADRGPGVVPKRRVAKRGDRWPPQPCSSGRKSFGNRKERARATSDKPRRGYRNRCWRACWRTTDTMVRASSVSHAGRFQCGLGMTPSSKMARQTSPGHGVATSTGVVGSK
ncbi:MAG: hypothetical protein DLM70_01335 [Chloroflexi bacterium]|nr:MAG: hypothetical protein DLM70_01335 [Chloroflexota bacterium]